jgi:pilus assembly protein CpaB
MKNRPIIMIAIAVLFGAVSIFVADIWLESAVNAKVSTNAPIVEQKPAVIFNTIVVAVKPLRYGEILTENALKEIPWPEGELPKGAFKKIEDVLAEKERVVLSPIEISEPVLLAKISGENGRAALSNMLGVNMRAVTIRVDDVAGVAGFITPGDRVDISLTRKTEIVSSQVLLQNIKVLTVDQKAMKEVPARNLLGLLQLK